MLKISTRRGLLATLALASPALALAAVPPAAAPAAAQRNDERVRDAFGNTIVSTYDDGRTGELWLSPNGTYRAEGRRHDPSSGHWRVKGDRLCLKQSRPVAIFLTYCTTIPETGMGKPWPAKSAMGDHIMVKLVKGHVSGG